MEEESCIKLDLPCVTANFCAPNTNFGRIDKVYLSASGFDPNKTWASLINWETKLDNCDEDHGISPDYKMRYFNVIGDKPLAERTKIDFSLGRSLYTEPKHTVNFRIDETDELNYAFIQFLDENPGLTLRAWFAAGKYMYGGQDGVKASITLGDVIPENDEELNTFVGVLTFEGKHPDRTINPLL